MSSSSPHNDQNASEVVPDSTSHEAVLRKLSQTDSSDSIDNHPSSPTQRLSRPPSTSRSSSYKRMKESSEPPQSRRQAAITYGKKRDALPMDEDEEHEEHHLQDATATADASHSVFGSAGILDESSESPKKQTAWQDVDMGSDDDDTAPGEVTSVKKFRFGFLKELDELNKRFEEEDRKDEQLGGADRGVMAGLTRSETEGRTGPGLAPPPHHLFATSSLSALTLSSSTSSPEHLPASLKPRPTRRVVPSSPNDRDTELEEDGLQTAQTLRPPKKRRGVIPDSDSEKSPFHSPTSPPKLSKRSSPSSPSSPTPDRVFGSPPSDGPDHRPSSPPTSPQENQEAGATDSGGSVGFAARMNRPKLKARTSQVKKDKPQRVKAPSRKQLQETEKETARLLAGSYTSLSRRKVFIPEPEQSRYSLGHLFQRIQASAVSSVSSSRHVTAVTGHTSKISSDPIESSQAPQTSGTPTVISSSPSHFSSEPTVPGSKSKSGSKPFPGPVTPPPAPKKANASKSTYSDIDIGLGGDDEDDEMPEIDDILRADAIRRKAEQEEREKGEREERRQMEEEARYRALQQRKRELVAKMEKANAPALADQGRDNDEDEELEIESSCKTAVDPQSSYSLKAPPSAASKTRLSTGSTARKPDVLALAKIAQGRSAKQRAVNAKAAGDALSMQLSNAARVQAAEARRAREEAWTARGGKTARQKQIEELEHRKAPGKGAEDNLEEAGSGLSKSVKKGIEVAEQRRDGPMRDEAGEEGDDEEDEDFHPEGEDGDDDDADSDKENATGTRDVDFAAAEDEPDEDQENVPPRPAPVQSRSTSPAFTEDAEDKENMPPELRRRAVLTDEDDLFSPQRPAAQQEDEDEDDEDEDFGALAGPSRRAPLRRIVDDDEDEAKVNSLLGPSKDDNPLARIGAKLTFDSNSDEGAAPRKRGVLPFAAAKDSTDAPQAALDFDMGEADADAEGDGFTQLFQLETKPAGFDALRRNNPLDDLDFESQKLLPAMHLSTQELRADDAIFEEDQLAKAMIERQERRQAMAPQKYLNEDGFFTQTKPATQQVGLRLPFDSPAAPSGGLFGRSAPQFGGTFFNDPPFSQAETVVPDDFSQAPTGGLKRLVRGQARANFEAEAEESSLASASAAPTGPRNAFEMMMQPKQKDPSKAQKSKEKQRAIKAAFVHGEAYESDEDVLQGFGGGGKEDDEDDDDDDEQNKVVEGLVDDANMDADAENAEAVMEKAMEHAAAADAEDERVAKLAAEGKLRGKKRDRGIGLNDDDSEESDDDDDRRRRRAVNKKRRIEGDTMDELEKNPRTLAFFQAYQNGIADDNDNDFGVGPSSDAVDPQGDSLLGGNTREDDDEQEDMEEEAPKEIITPEQLRRALREAARNDEKSIDPHDVSWMEVDNEDEDEDSADMIREVVSGKKPAYRALGQTEVDAEAVKEKFRLKQLNPSAAGTRAREGKSTTTFGANKAGSAITGHAAVKKSASSLSSSTVGAGSRKGRPPVAKTASLLSKVSTKKGGFGA